MTRNTKILAAVTLAMTLSVGSAFASGVAKLPDEVKSSSIKLPHGTESRTQFAQYAKVSQQQAEAAALAVQQGKVIKSKLDEEDGYLVWQVYVKHARGTTEVAVDAGNGKVLAAESGDDREHADRRERD